MDIQQQQDTQSLIQNVLEAGRKIAGDPAQQQKNMLAVNPYVDDPIKFYDRPNVRLGGQVGLAKLSDLERQIAAGAYTAAEKATVKESFRKKYVTGSKRDSKALQIRKIARGKEALKEDERNKNLSLDVYQKMGKGIYQLLAAVKAQLGNVYADKYGMVYSGLLDDGSKNFFSKRQVRAIKDKEIDSAEKYAKKAALRVAAAYNYLIRSLRAYQRIIDQPTVEYNNFQIRSLKNREPGTSFFRRNMAAGKRYQATNMEELLNKRRQGVAAKLQKTNAKTAEQYAKINADAQVFAGKAPAGYKMQEEAVLQKQSYKFPEAVEVQYDPLALLNLQQQQ